MKTRTCFFLLAGLWAGVLPSVLAAAAAAQEITVANDQQLREALRDVQPGAVIRVGPGEYAGGHHVRGVASLTIEAIDPARPPVFVGGGAAWQFSRCDKLTVRNIRTRGQIGNGLNIDNGDASLALTADVTLDHVTVEDVGPTGNRDGIKCSGLSRLTIRHCRIAGWGGEAIDLVGCHDSLIADCQLEGKAGFSMVTGVQLKGGTADVVVERCRFVQAGQRPVNVGGSTGLPYFRPLDARYEARRITIRNNVFEGGVCAAAFDSTDGAEFTDNTILFPTKWIFRILQGNREPGFATCGNVVVRNNRIVFHRSQVQIDVNIGPHTRPETFQFVGNHWFAADRPAASRPQLPVAELAGHYGVDPRTK